MKLAEHGAQEPEQFGMCDRVSAWRNRDVRADFHNYSSHEAWSPGMNIYEQQDEYGIVVDLAGVLGDDIDLRTEGNELILTGTRELPRLPEMKADAKLRLMEIDHGRFTRSLELPDDANSDAITAAYKCGFLWIRIRKV